MPPFRGLTIDTISCVSIVLVIGLCVDYNSHIAHAYIVSFGSSREAARDVSKSISGILVTIEQAMVKKSKFDQFLGRF